jgi:hypothetical protein
VLMEKEPPQAVSLGSVSNIERLEWVRDVDNARNLTLSRLIVDTKDSTLLNLSFRLSGSKGVQPYPDLELRFDDANGAFNRRLYLSSRDYQHGQSLRDETVKLSIPREPGDMSVHVLVCYPSKDGQRSCIR